MELWQENCEKAARPKSKTKEALSKEILIHELKALRQRVAALEALESERKEFDPQFLQAQKMEAIGTLAGGIAHDFNNILAVIMGNASLAKLHVEPGEKIFELLEAVEKASSKAKDLTQKLITFSKGGVPIKKVAPMGDLLKDTTSLVLSGSNIRCEFSIPEDLWEVKIDEGQISQVIGNLITNAREAMPQGGEIRVQGENVVLDRKSAPSIKEGSYVLISIADEGKGISKEHIGKIFDPYFSTKEKGPQKGLGLGLGICHSIIKQHSGHISVESQLGLGTTVSVCLPAYERERTESAEKRSMAESAVPEAGKILFMDDEDVIRDVAGKMLNRIGYEVEFARNGDEAIELYENAQASGESFDAVILDLTIKGGMGGKEAIERLLDIDPNVKAVISSGYSDSLTMGEYKKYGFSGVVAKPYMMQELSEVVHKAIHCPEPTLTS